jgi:ribosomal protein S18 acetylase RimI-like enzyme
MSESFRIRLATRNDSTAILALIREFAGFEKLDHLARGDEKSLEDALFTENRFCAALVVETDSRLVGYSIFYPIFRSFSGVRALYLEDLYIKSEFRKTGLGRRLLAEISKYAIENGYSRIDFQVLEWNDHAIGFYRKFGALEVVGNKDFSLEGEALKTLAND